MRISDWSSDVCSSDLTEAHRPPGRAAEQLAVAHGDVAATHGHHRPAGHRLTLEGGPAALRLQPIGLDRPPGLQIDQREVAVIADGDAAFSGDVEIGRASWRESVCQYV